MQWNQPGPADRLRVLIFSATGALFGWGLAFVLITTVVRGVPFYENETSLSLLNRVAIGSMALISGGLAALCTDVFVKVRRGTRRRTSRVLRSEEPTLIVALLAIALATLAFATGGVDALLNGRSDAHVLGWIFVVLVGGLGLVCLGGAITVGWNMITRGPSTLTLEGDHVEAGLPLAALLEIPFAASEAPAAVVSVQLTRWEAPVSSDDATSSSIAWTEHVQIDEWSAAGPRRSSARVTYRIPEGSPADVTNPRVSYVWSLDVRPVGDVAWNAQFTLPIRFVEDEARAA
jgi:hypothetical protein